MTKSKETPTETEKYFDCMAWLERVQAEIYEEIKDLTLDSLQAFPRRRWTHLEKMAW